MKNSILKVFYGSAKNKKILIELIALLKNKYNWYPEIISLGSDDIKQFKDHFLLANTSIVKEDDLRSGDFLRNIESKNNFLDLETLNFFKKYETNAMSWFQDSNGFNFSFRQRHQYLYDLIKYWSKLLEKKKPDLYVALTWPHMPADYVLYLLLKKYYKIPVLFLDPVPHFNLPRFSIGTDMHDLSSVYRKKYIKLLNENNIKKNDIVENYLDKMRSKKASMPLHAKKYYEFFDKQSKKFLVNYLVLLKKFFTFSLFDKTNLFIKTTKKEIFEEKINMNYIEYFIYLHKKLLKNFSSRLFYKKYSSKFNIKKIKKYILFLDSYQPEAISNPLQYEFENHILIIENLLSKLPDDYTLVFKEHPGIFMKLGEGYLFRNQTYYKRLKYNGKIHFAPVEHNTYDLIDNADAVATSGGTGGWEALIRGKKVISFGNSWYNDCKGVFNILKSGDIDNVMDLILKKKNNPTQDHVRSYAYSIFENTFVFDDKILPSSNYEQNFMIDKNMMNELADNFYKSYQLNYKNKITNENINQ